MSNENEEDITARVAAKPEFHEHMRQMMANFDAEYAEEDAAIARGDLVPAPMAACCPRATPPSRRATNRRDPQP